MSLKHPHALCVILAAGDILDYGAVARQIPHGALIFCADAGYAHCGKLGVYPDLLIGDFDSLTGDIPADIPRITLPADKNYTDTAHAIEEAIELGCSHLLLAGMLGGRLDHTLSNLQSLTHCARKGISARITDGVTDVLPLFTDENNCRGLVISPKPEHYFSVFSMFGEARGVTITGAKYPLDDYTLTSGDPRALSNEFLDGPVTISAESGDLLVVVTPKT